MPVLYVVFIIYLAFSAGALVLLKFGSSNFSMLWDTNALQIRIDPWFVSGLFLYVLSFLLSLYLIKNLNLSFLYPLSAGIINVSVCALSFFVLKESISPLHWGGIFLIAAGIVLINVK